LVWEFSRFVDEARSGAFPGSRFYVYRIEFFGHLRDLMLLVVALLTGLSGYWLLKALTE
jgi:hypothetical protein